MRSDTCWIVVLAETIDGIRAENAWIVALAHVFRVSLVYLLCLLLESFLLEFFYKQAV